MPFVRYTLSCLLTAISDLLFLSCLSIRSYGSLNAVHLMDNDAELIFEPQFIAYEEATR